MFVVKIESLTKLNAEINTLQQVISNQNKSNDACFPLHSREKCKSIRYRPNKTKWMHNTITKQRENRLV